MKSRSTEVRRTVGRRIGELRESLGLTQEQMSEALHFTPKYQRHIEAGENLTIDSLVRLADFFGVPITALFEEPKTPRRKAGRPRGKKKAPTKTTRR